LDRYAGHWCPAPTPAQIAALHVPHPFQPRAVE
jgi:hypothetical protein